MKLIILVTFFVTLTQAAVPVWYPGGKCGLSKYKEAGNHPLPTPTIVGGVKAKEHEFPWQISLQKVTNNFHFCGGSIINEKWIVTAAHCVSKKTFINDTIVVVGDHHQGKPNKEKVSHVIEKVISHPKYTVDKFELDIALIKLKKNININDNVRPVCAPDPKGKYEFKKVIVSGWGTISFGGQSSKELLYTTLNTTINELCQKHYPFNKITPDMICATDNKGSTERDSCQGDSGGPLTTKEGDKFSLVGVVSWGKGCASKAPGVYHRVSYTTDWVTETIKEN